MKIKELQLFTNQLEKQKEFFLNVLGCELYENTEHEFCLNIGWSKLKFVQSDSIHLYHYCFLIPSNKLHEALAWMNSRTATVDLENGEKIVHFEDWNAESFYFYDGGGNIAEFIVRYDLKNEIDSAFDLDKIIGVNEIGLGTTDIEKVNYDLEEKTGSLLYKGDLTRFGTNGSDEGMFLIPNYNLKETWFPTEIKIKAEPFESIVEINSQNYFVNYRAGNLVISKI